MPEIRILSDRVANQIAAGEVVERPAAVVKELIENSIDAGAQKIEIEFRNGGKSYLRVEDDGRGMSQDQALLSLERHATSKIRNASDLKEVKTFGFRGEALPSIASVSRFLLRTRTSNDSQGSEVFMNGGKLVHVKECGMPQGTRIEVSHLFNSVPGRRKFLKTEATESTHIIHFSKLYALAHPAIEFSLVESGRTIFRSPVCEDITQRVREIFGKSLSECLAPISVESGSLKLAGLIGKPGQSRSTRKEMLFFVNHRPVDNKTLTYAVLEAYHTFSPKGRFPPVVLFLSIDPEQLDVNVHPAKREIRFREEGRIRNFLIESLLNRNKEISGKVELVKPLDYDVDQDSGLSVPQIDAAALGIYGKTTSKPKQDLSPEDSLDQSSSFSEDNETSTSFSPLPSIIEKIQVAKRDSPNALWRLIDRPKGGLAVFATVDGIVYFHERAAYDRIRFEQLEDSFQHKEVQTSQTLLFPESLELDGIDGKFLAESLQKLNAVGFSIEEFGRNFYRVEGCPNWVKPEVAVQFLRDFLELARESGGSMDPEKLAKETLVKQTSLERHKSRDSSDDEIIRLAEQLLNCRNPYNCPKGNSTYFEVPWRDLETRFKRKL